MTDANGNTASATAIVTIQDKVLPTVITKTITVLLNATGSVTISDRDVDNGSSDACGLVLYKLDKTKFTCFDVGNNTVTFTVTDANGNQASKTAVVIVQGRGAISWIIDNDADGYHLGTPIIACTSPGVGYIEKTTQLAGDCADNNASVNPAAVEVCGNRIDDNCNGVFYEAICFPCQNATNLQTTNITATGAQLNWTAVANPVQWQVQFKTTRQGSKWVDVFVTGNRRLVVLTGLINNQNYQWQIRARCGNNWTSYSNPSSFTAGAANLLSRGVVTPTADETKAEPAVGVGVRVYPNPSQGQFMLEMQLPDKDNSIVNIQVIDLTGTVLQTETSILVQGNLKKNMSLNAALAKGMYSLRITTGNKTYHATILFVK